MLKLVRDLLSPDKHRPRVHPNGFIQIDLDAVGETRLHIWPDEQLDWMPHQETEHPMHDHKFEMRSTILRGTLAQKVIAVDLTMEPTHEIFTAQYTGSQTRNSVLAGTGVFVAAGVKETIYNGPGMAYTQRARTFHETSWLGLTVTLMEKTAFVDHEPRVLVPLGVEPDNSYNRWAVSEEEIWQYIWKAMTP